MCGGHDNRFRPFFWRTATTFARFRSYWDTRREDDKDLYPTVLNHVDVVWETRLTLVTENEINDRPKPDKTPTRVELDVKSVK